MLTNYNRSLFQVGTKARLVAPFKGGRHFSKTRISFDDAADKEKLQNLKQELQTWKEKYQNILSEKEGIQNRTAKEIEEAKLYGIKNFAKSLLNVNDNLGLAIINTDLQSSEPKEQLEILIEGLKMTQVEADDALSKESITKFSPEIGDRFDQYAHNAVKTEKKVGETKSETITKVVRHGYKLKNKVLRFADVEVLTVSTPPPPKKPEPPKVEETKQEQPIHEKPNDSSSSSESESESDNETNKESKGKNTNNTEGEKIENEQNTNNAETEEILKKE